MAHEPWDGAGVRLVWLGWRPMAAQVGGREQRTKTARAGMVVWEVAGERVRHAHPDCDRESIRWRNGATAYKGNKEPRRRGIFICPSTHSEGRRFIMDRRGIAFFSRSSMEQLVLVWGWSGQCGFVETAAQHYLPTETRKQNGRHTMSGQKTLL